MRKSSPRLTRLVIDTDIGVDDAVAIVLALKWPLTRIEAMTTVSGNTDVAQATRNGRYVVELCDATAPIYGGAAEPIDRPARHRGAVHGGDGLGDLGLRPVRPDADPGRAADRLVELARADPGSLTLVTLGPLTNIALALRRAPELASAFRRVVVMGSATDPRGAAEFNVWSDPTAAREVFAAGLPLTLVPIELSGGDAAHTRDDQELLGNIPTPQANFVASMCGAAAKRSNDGRAGLPDAIAMAVALDPTLALRSNRYCVTIDADGITAMHSADSAMGLSAAHVVEEIDATRYKDMLRRALR